MICKLFSAFCGLLTLFFPLLRVDIAIADLAAPGQVYADTITTSDGHIWGSTSDLRPGDRVFVLFHTNGTEDVVDDWIIHIDDASWTR